MLYTYLNISLLIQNSKFALIVDSPFYQPKLLVAVLETF